MTAPRLILPSGAMPWGRWVEDNISATERALAAQTSDQSSVGSQFASRATTLSDQIRGIPSVASIVNYSVPNFSVTRTNFATRNVFDSPEYTFSPPRGDQPYEVSVIVNMRAEGVMFPFSSSILRVNGTDYMFNNENSIPGYEALPVVSLMGTATLGVGDILRVQFGIAANATGTASFLGCQLTIVYTGSLS